ncbi:MAG: hypothetical protein A3I39_01295 [Candidatus Yanofskybacteria bacterium RIFCSPLOWO2_02_FULL_47_9b]|uniref:DNA 3'-5' helicase n=1 Tax=Candidatus Yanofskybacteria bacterium RIFCSPLOWO2_02_FULL_47_9b TaxID=1802708 RepID=A0A1F8HBC2_9BACT|nr:MAG: hypothetical protein A3I39_01295 [Candidatus Yanofskybacteria bacterium RIFCSPLOWO2_02_FULL_47_9b]
MAEFEEYYKQLNKAQREAVDTVEGPVMVVAGPGTGKTQILTLRIANILRETQVGPENILALTFTEAGAVAMRRRLAEIIGSLAYHVRIGTFHGFCNDIIKKYPEEFPRVIGADHITEVEQVQVIQEIITRLSLKLLKPFGDPFYFVRDINSAIQDLKREGVEPSAFKKIVDKERKSYGEIEDLKHEKGPHKGKIKGEYIKLEKQIAKNNELAAVYEEYQKELDDRRQYDYSDMIMEVIRELAANKDLILILQEQYQYILVDEHQDTNNAQNKVVELLASFHPDPNVFIVGDEKQAIFRFQGASLENFKYFKKKYPSAKLIVLEDNYRSQQTVLDAAHSLLAGERELQAKAGHQIAKIRVAEFKKPAAELYFLAKDITSKIAGGTPAHEIAVLYRDNKDAFEVARMFEKLGVPFSIESDQDVLADDDIRKFIFLLRAVATFGSDEKFMETLHIDFLGIDPLEAYKLINRANRERVSIYNLIPSTGPIADFYVKLKSWRTLSKNQNAEQVFETVMRESGFLDTLLKKPELSEKFGKIGVLFDALQSLVNRRHDFSLDDFIRHLDAMREHRLSLKRQLSIIPDRVRLMTAHRSKGQEFGSVYIVMAFDGHWGNRWGRDLLTLPISVYTLSGSKPAPDEDESDERRLFYVAMTRTKKHLTISYSLTDHEGKEKLPSQFISEIRTELTEKLDTSKIEKEWSSKPEMVFAKSQPVHAKPADFVKELFTQYGLSVTGLNNYLKCPWQYFYTNLLRIPKAKTKHQMYGTAVHGALKDFFNLAKEKKKMPPVEFLLEHFEYYLSKEPFTKFDHQESLTKGKESLRGYYANYVGTWALDTITEFSIKGISLTPDITINGKLDKLEIDSGDMVAVIDYKTSKPKSRNDIEGNTKNSDGNTKRQLVFYKLLLDKYEGRPKYKMSSAQVDFIEPDDKGKFHKEAFRIEDSEVKDLETLIKKVGMEILGLKFWNKTCEDKDCEFCALRKMM